MADPSQALLAGLPEHVATGRLAEIYHEIRLCSGVPYVSSLQRYLATLPGVLEWAWDALRPALMSGVISETGWRLAREVRLPPAVPVAARTLVAWGIDAADLGEIRNIARNFIRVSPVNLVTGACLARLLHGEAPSGPGFAAFWSPPVMLPPMPGNVDPDQLPKDQRVLLMRFARQVDGVPFIPALYRQIAHWPAVLEWLADELAPRFDAPETATARSALRAAAWDAAAGIVAALPGLPRTAPPDRRVSERGLAAIDRYAETSPEMTMFGQLILEALPETLAA